MTPKTTAPVPEQRLVGADRVLAVLTELAEHPLGVGLDELARTLHSPKPTVHRALAALRRAGFADQSARGVYLLGDEFLRVAFRYQDRRPESARVEPLLHELAARYGETAHYAVLDGAEVVYRGKVDPPEGAVRLTSTVGGRNPAYRTAVGKLLLSYEVGSEAELTERLGAQRFEARTPKTITAIPDLFAELQRTHTRGYGLDDQENETGVNCVALPVFAGTQRAPVGAVSVSALAFRCPLERLVDAVPQLREKIARTLGWT